MLFEIEKRFNIVDKRIGEYTSFPTLLKQGENIFLACRTGIKNPKIAHGDGGKIRFFVSRISHVTQWDEIKIAFNVANEKWHELDAILSHSKGNGVILITRRFEGTGGNKPFFSEINADEIEQAIINKSIFIHREALANKLVKSSLTSTLTFAACFGHIRSCDHKTLLMSCYAVIGDDRWPSPVILMSNDCAESWKLYSVIENSDNFGAYLNEFSIIKVDQTHWLAVIRTNANPFPLYYSMSQDDGKTWSKLEATGLYGHAPMLEQDAAGNVLLLYRDLEIEVPYLSVAWFVADKKWQRGIKITDYNQVYDGGYGDLIAISPNRLLVAAYRDDEDCSPWIEAYIIRYK